MVQFIAVGDTGSGHKEQYLVAKTIENLCKNKPINSILLLGDNIYEEGVDSVNDKKFKTKFEDPYKNINKVFHVCLGNHDYGNDFYKKGNENFQIQYSKLSKKWSMPAKYYSIKKGPCEIFFLDTNFEFMSESVIMKQFYAMLHKIKHSKSKWNILCGHHTWRSVGGHGNAEKRFEIFMNDLLKAGARIDLYMCGHDHCKNIIIKQNPYNPKNKIHLVVVGTGGKFYPKHLLNLNNMKKEDSELLFHSPNLGICLLDATSKRIKLTCYNERLIKEFYYEIK